MQNAQAISATVDLIASFGRPLPVCPICNSRTVMSCREAWRSVPDRRSEGRNTPACVRPPSQQLALFARRLRRALGSERGREFFGVARGEYDFSIYPDVRRVLEWLETSAGMETEGSEQPPNLEKMRLRKAL